MTLSFEQAFNQMKIIHCMCPKCNDIMRTSDLRLSSSVETERTWRDAFDSEVMDLSNKKAEFDAKKKQMLEEARERGGKQVPKIVNKILKKNFTKLNYNPYDIKSILHPIDFVTFDGMKKDQIKKVVLLSDKAANPHLQGIHEMISDAVKNRSYDWQVLRLSNDGGVKYES